MHLVSNNVGKHLKSVIKGTSVFNLGVCHFNIQERVGESGSEEVNVTKHITLSVNSQAR